MNPYKPLPSRKELNVRISGGRIVMLISVIITVINIVLAVTKELGPFLYNIAVPYYLVLQGKLRDNNFNIEDLTRNGRDTYIALAIAAAILLVYLLLILMAKKGPGWSVAMLVLFSIDTVGIFFVGQPEMLVVDLCIHIWVIYLLSRQVHSAYQLKDLDLVEQIMAEDEAAALEAKNKPAEEAAEEEE